MKKRLDVLMFEKGLAESREKARALIMSGIVFVDGARVDKPGSQLTEEAEIEVRGEQLRYVSRGGLKLEKALKVFGVSPQGKVCIDCGASTGGFTDCLLQNGAVKVYAVDVGYGQLAWKLRSDERVVCMERTNIRYVTPEDLPETADMAVIDVSFISLAIVLPAVKRLIKEGDEVVCLVKPQFEAGKDKVGKKGVVREQSVHIEVVEGIVAFLLETGFSVLGLDYSPVKGPQGNIEYLVLVEKTDAPQNGLAVTAIDVVTRAHEALDKETAHFRKGGVPYANRHTSQSDP